MALTKKTIKEISASSGYEPSDKELEKIQDDPSNDESSE